MTTDPSEIQGAWSRGWTLDEHTTSSTFLGYDQNGRARYDTKRTELGEAVYQLKYRGRDTADEIAAVLTEFVINLQGAASKIELVVPMPPSTQRQSQPVARVAAAVAKKLGKTFSGNAIVKIRNTQGLKDIDNPETRRELLDGAFDVDAEQVKERGVLLVDDLYRSGATANAVTVALLKAGAARVYFLAATRTRASR